MLRRALLLAALAALLVAGCGGSAGKGSDALLFVSVKDGDYAIFGANADGKHARRLTKEKGDPSTPAGLFFQVQPAWSPDAQKIVFSSGRDGTPHIFAMNADGTGTTAAHGLRQGRRPSVVVGGRQDRLLPGGRALRDPGGRREGAPGRARLRQRHEPGLLARRQADRLRLPEAGLPDPRDLRHERGRHRHPPGDPARPCERAPGLVARREDAGLPEQRRPALSVGHFEIYTVALDGTCAR